MPEHLHFEMLFYYKLFSLLLYSVVRPSCYYFLNCVCRLAMLSNISKRKDFDKHKNSWIKTSSLRITRTRLLKFTGSGGRGRGQYGAEVGLSSASSDFTSLVPR